MISVTKSKIEISVLLPDRYQETADFLVSFPGETRDRKFWLDRFSLWWETNPAFSKGVERGWILTDAEKIVGFLGNLPSLFQISGQSQVVYSCTTWRVLPEYRNRSLYLLMHQIRHSENSILFDTSPSERVLSIIRTLGFVPIPRNDSGMNLWIVNWKNVLKSKAGSNPFAKFTAQGIALVLTFLQPFQLPKSAQEKYAVKALSSVGAEFDELWQKTHGRYSNTNVRTAQTVRWYCSVSPREKKWLFGCYKDGELAAYMIVCSCDGRRGPRALECLDFWGDEKKEILVFFIGALHSFAEDQGFDYLIFPNFTKRIGDFFRELKLIQKPLKERLEFLRIGSGLKLSIDAENSFFTSAQGDRGF